MSDETNTQFDTEQILEAAGLKGEETDGKLGKLIKAFGEGFSAVNAQLEEMRKAMADDDEGGDDVDEDGGEGDDDEPGQPGAMDMGKGDEIPLQDATPWLESLDARMAKMEKAIALLPDVFAGLNGQVAELAKGQALAQGGMEKILAVERPTFDPAAQPSQAMLTRFGGKDPRAEAGDLPVNLSPAKLSKAFAEGIINDQDLHWMKRGKLSPNDENGELARKVAALEV